MKLASHRPRIPASRGIPPFAPLLPALLAAVIAACAPSPVYRPRPPAVPPDTSSRAAAQAPSIPVSIVAPIADFARGRITSRFGAGRSGSRNGHEGIDIDAEKGEEVLAAATGTVAFAGQRRGYGNLVVIDHGAFTTSYGHLFYATVRAGASVSAGDRIGRAGKRGRATGTHLHFEIRIDGRPIDPEPYLCLDSPPVSP